MIKRCFGAMALILGVMPGPGAAQDALPMLPFGEETRFHAIGRVNAASVGTTRMCTGTLIAPDLVVTAAHCLFRKGARQIPTDKLRFVAGYDRGEYAALGFVAEVMLHPMARQAGRFTLSHDMAVLRLTVPMEGIAPLPLGEIAQDDEAAIVGYHVRRPERLSAGFDCTAQATQGVLLIGCPVREGNSGGPVLVEGPEGWQVVGVVSATDGHQAISAPVNDWLRALLPD